MKSTLKINNQKYSIFVKIHKRRTSNEYQLDIKNFYEKWGGKIPKGQGYEIEILNNEEIQVWHQTQRRLLNSEDQLATLHIHSGNDQKPYVCYPLQIKTKREAEKLFSEWARIMFVQIFFGLSDSFLYEKTQSGSTTEWSKFTDSFLKEKGLQID
jgi:hypothetical protein